MKYLDFYNLIFTKNNLNGYIAFGESINNGSFLGGLSRFILKNKDWISSLISHKVSLKESSNILKKIFYKKNVSKNKNFNYIKCVIKNN